MSESATSKVPMKTRDHSLHGYGGRHINVPVKSGTVFFIASKFPVFFITFTLLTLPLFTDGEGDVVISLSSLRRSFVSDQSHDRNRKRRTLCKQIKLFPEPQAG